MPESWIVVAVLRPLSLRLLRDPFYAYPRHRGWAVLQWAEVEPPEVKIGNFKQFLLRKYGGYMRAWRQGSNIVASFGQTSRAK
eukprot:163799-Amphidinium_carterae.1